MTLLTTTPRYVPRAINGGPSWMVWDRKEGRFIETDELKSIPMTQLEERIEITAAKD